MIEAQQVVVIDTDIDTVWDYVQDISRWAELFPGCRECEIVDDRRSKWLIKVGAGGMVKRVNVLVNVDQWSGPERVDFSYRLESESVTGSGSYSAICKGPQATEINLHLKVEGSGQMAPMWEAMSKPLLPQMAGAFAARLKSDIELANGIAGQPGQSVFAALLQWLRRIWKRPAA